MRLASSPGISYRYGNVAITVRGNPMVQMFGVTNSHRGQGHPSMYVRQVLPKYAGRRQWAEVIDAGVRRSILIITGSCWTKMRETVGLIDERQRPRHQHGKEIPASGSRFA